MPCHRMLYRALPDLRVMRAHWCYVAGDGDNLRVLWGPPEYGRQEDSVDLGHAIRVEHRSRWRDQSRQTRARAYYQLRDTLGVEALSEVHVEHVDGGMARVA